MNPQHLNYNNHNQAAAFHQEKQKWESAISNYQGADPLELWYDYICWYEQNIHLDHERSFERILGKCLSIYESQQHYKQDTRFVKLWMKYIGLKSNPLNLYQVLYQRGIGTQCSIFYIGWAHYYDAANAFKQAESVYNLGFQANAQPYSALERAHKDFRFSLSQRMLYSDQQTKKRTVSQLNDQRQQLTSLNPSSTPPNVSNFQHAKSNYTPAAPVAPVNQQQQQNAYVPPTAQQQPQHHTQEQPPSQSQSTYQNYQNYDPPSEQLEQQQPPAKKFRASTDEQRTSNYNQNYNEESIPQSVVQTEITSTNYPRKTETNEFRNQYVKSTMDETKGLCDELDNSTSAACAIASSLNSVYSGDEDGSEDYGYTAYNNATTSAMADPELSTKYSNDSIQYSTTATHTTSTTPSQAIVTSSITDQSSPPGACNLPPNFARSAKNHYNPWHWPIFLDEPDTNKICKYPRHLVYPGNGCEYSLEEIRARNYAKVIESIKERNRQRETMLNEQKQQQQQQQQQQPYNQMQQQQQFDEQQQAYERQRSAEISERERIEKERERSRLAALELQQAKEQEQQRLAEQQKMQQMMQQQMQEQTAYQHQQPKQCHIQAASQSHTHSLNTHNHTNYYASNQSQIYNNYANYSVQQPQQQNQLNSSAQIAYQPNGSPVPYHHLHQNSSPVQYHQNSTPISAYPPQNHQNSINGATTVPYQQGLHQSPMIPYQQMSPQPQLQPPSQQQQQVASMVGPQYYSPQNHIAPTQPHTPSTSAMHYTPPSDNQNEMYRPPLSQPPPPPPPPHNRYMPQQTVLTPSYHQHHQQYANHVAPQQPPLQYQQDGNYQTIPPFGPPHPQHTQYSTQPAPAPAPAQQQQQQYPPSQISHTYVQPLQTNHSSAYQYESQPSAPPNHENPVRLDDDMSRSVTETKTVNSFADDIEEQIEASTIVLKNGSDKLQKITIKYRKEKVESGGTNNGNLSSRATTPTSMPKVQKEKKPKKPKSHDIKRNNSTIQCNVETESENSTFLENDEQFSESNDSFSTPIRINKLSKSKKSIKSKTSKLEATYLHDDSDSCSSSGFTKLYGKYSDEAANDGTANRNVRFNFAGATSTPIRSSNNNNNNIGQYRTSSSSPCSSAKPSYKSNESSSKSSTPRNTYNKSLRRRTSNTSLLNSGGVGGGGIGTGIENDDSMSSFSMVEPNSFFETEANDELYQQRLDKALKTIDVHLKKDHIDPFSSELCKAFLTKANFPSREHNEFYRLSNSLLAKLSNTKSVTIGDTRFNVEKEIGRGAYGSVYRGLNTNTSDVVALKYQKPPNTWELYICSEVHQRIKDPNLLLGYMDISSAIISPNASIFITEFSPFGSLLDINNRIRQSTTKVMHESLVMHFTSQILKIVHYLHSGEIIHGDIKPDNFLLMKIPNPNSDMPTLRLIDFGCAIDMKFFEPKTQFKKVIQTDGFTCPEMLEGRLWSYQTDIFCVAGTVHVMLFGEYMQMVKKFGQYEIKQKLPRYLKKHIWTEFFATFLNIKDANHLPNLLKMKTKIDNELNSMESELQSQIRTLSNILYKR